jgi:hypothetical protein
MRTIFVVSSALLIMGLTAVVGAQTPASEPAAPQSASPPRSPSSPTEQYGLNLARIQRGLQRSAERQEGEGLNLRYYVNVYAPAPSIQLFTRQDNLAFGPAPYGAPTHRDMMNMITPQEFRAPVADFSGLARWLANRAKK